ncbi:hypothetical protein B0J12DRAFT_24715 [Macrophomina phaseolina]|uniref:NACHT domain-containing protein n=1 Tax=Macrophomina phaseolina TaxID=35725 RepID=A0ABQ8GXJ9_9PEZI|nr:hypothetical protein B0J12DRAFT_24715 [Macrophomina phaseolina]
MAEGLAAVGVVASIIQLVQFSAKVVRRLEQFHSDAGEIPKSLRHINAELPVLETTLQQIGQDIKAGSVNIGNKDVLIPVIEGCREQIVQLDAILAKMLPETNDKWWTKNKKAMLSLHQDDKIESITKVLRNYIATLTFYHTAASSTLQPLTDAKLTKIRKWLSAPDPSLNYQKAQKQRQAGTGLWFLESDQYAQWKTNAASFLWLHGIPGCGKTILSSAILHDVHQHCDNDPGKVVAYFYFDFNDVQKQNPELMLRSLICQLSYQCVKIPASLDALFSCDSGQRQPSQHALMEVVHQTMQEFPHVYIVLDALDECSERGELADILETIAAWQLQNLHVLVTSRKERDIESSLTTFIDQQRVISLHSELVDRDIQKYVWQRLSDDKSLKKWQKDATVRQEIEAALTKGAHGMFRWAVCQLDELGKCRTRAMLRKALATLPPTLDETYDRILSAISEADSQYAIRILQWLTFSARSLSVDEVAEIVAIDVKDEPRFDRDEVLEDPLEVLNICSSLITMTTDKRGGRLGLARQVVVLAHYSVKEYLLSDRIQKGSAAHYGMQATACHDAIAKGCLGYLLQFQRSELLSRDATEEFKLAEYCAEFWMKHARATEERTEGFSQVAMNLLLKKSDAYLNWLRIHDPERPQQRFNFSRVLGPVPAPLYYVSLFGLRKIVKLLVEKGADVNAQGGYYGNALQAASVRGHEQVVRLLLEKGADVNAQGGRYGNALQAASVGGHEQEVRLLVEKGADVNAQGGYYGNALQAASVEGHEQVVRLLLEKGADVNAQGGYYGNALQAASVEGHEQVVRLLLEKGADVNAQGGEYGNALYAASVRGYEQVVKLLLKKGANTNVER